MTRLWSIKHLRGLLRGAFDALRPYAFWLAWLGGVAYMAWLAQGL